jgi:clan AA aspartic protease (TIGR02281 family)
MRQLVAILLVGISMGGIPFAAEAGIYRWTDAAGTVHFTESLAEVPAEQRAQVRRQASESRESRHFQQYGTNPQLHTALMARSAGGAIRVPFEREGNLIRLNVRLNDTLEAPFYLDTGASGIVLPQHVADQLGFRNAKGIGSVQVTTLAGKMALATMHLDSVELGGLKVANLRGMVAPTTDVGLLGAEFFENFTYAVDPAAQVLILHPSPALR